MKNYDHIMYGSGDVVHNGWVGGRMDGRTDGQTDRKSDI